MNQTNIEKAVELVQSGNLVGLGSGKAAWKWIEALGHRVQQGKLSIQGIAASEASADLARHYGIPVVSLSDRQLDLTVDGADEVDPNLNLIKGYGHALVREKIIAKASKRLIILVGPENIAEKIVPVLGTRGKLPIEVLPFALGFCQHQIKKLGLNPVLLRLSTTNDPDQHQRIFLSDNGNYILECETGPISDPYTLDKELTAIPGVVGTGLFLDIAEKVLIQRDGHCEERVAKRTR